MREEPPSDAFAHLQAAALSMVAAARTALDAAETLARDPGPMLAVVLDATRPAADPTDEATGTAAAPPTGVRRRRSSVEHIPVTSDAASDAPGGVRLEAIDHVQLAMPAGAEDQARHFYRGLLGLAEVRRPPLLAARGGVWFERGTVRVHLGVDPDFRPAGRAQVAFCVADVDALRRQASAAGCLIEDAEPVGGRCRFHLSDPFGNRLELVQAGADAAPAG